MHGVFAMAGSVCDKALTWQTHSSTLAAPVLRVTRWRGPTAVLSIGQVPAQRLLRGLEAYVF